VKLKERVQKNKEKHQRKLENAVKRHKARRTLIEDANLKVDDDGFDINDLLNGETGERASEEEDNSGDEEEHKEVKTLGRIMTCSYSKVNRYYTKEEDEEGLDGNIDENETIIVDAGANSEVEFGASDNDDGEFNNLLNRDKD
jgi:hypothetical protein